MLKWKIENRPRFFIYISPDCSSSPAFLYTPRLNIFSLLVFFHVVPTFTHRNTYNSYTCTYIHTSVHTHAYTTFYFDVHYNITMKANMCLGLFDDISIAFLTSNPIQKCMSSIFLKCLLHVCYRIDCHIIFKK